MIKTQKNNATHLRFCALSGALLDGVFGDKEIAVKIRGNSHYRNRGGKCSPPKPECLSGRDGRSASAIEVSWANGEMRQKKGYGRVSFFMCAPWRALLFYPFSCTNSYMKGNIT